jgi:hypothetical protein
LPLILLPGDNNEKDENITDIIKWNCIRELAFSSILVIEQMNARQVVPILKEENKSTE